MKLGLIINCIGQNIETASLLQEEYLLKIRPVLEDKFGFDVFPIFPNSDWLYNEIVIKQENLKNHQDKEAVLERLKINNKGFVVSGCLKRFKEFKCDVVLHIDGSRRFKLDSINDVAINFLEPSVEATLTVRDNSGISKLRELAEVFERFLIEEKYGRKIPDGQSGCWSFKLKNEDYNGNGINITAIGYEIELDILTELIRLNRKIIWKSIEVSTQGSPSQYNFISNSLTKIEFLCKKLNIDKPTLISLLSVFEKRYLDKIKLVEESDEGNFPVYKEAIENMQLTLN